MNKYYRTLDKKNTSIYFDIIASFTVDSANDAVAFTKDWSDAGNTVVLELQKGDLIFVKANDNFDNWIYGAAGEIDTTFSGELVFPETTAASLDKVAFCVSLTHNMMLNGDRVIYDKIFTNIGNGYDANTGVFTVSLPGLYMIHYHTLAQLGEINSAFGEAPGTWADHGNSAILELHAGDKVSVSGRPGSTVIVYGDASDEQLYATFSSFLLYALHGTPATAKIHGVYVFHYHALSDINTEVLIDLYHKDEYIDSLYGHHSNGWAGGSNSATLQLSVDDTVYLYMFTNFTTAMSGSPNDIYTTFSGYLLSPNTN
ncbi:C1QL [Mytilus coruscus]|uniref:C1QL n=1 Tax=Mytilus coruscus TaxID=42192 RepID=A0A6J8C7C2_MYTCO|nr:C1QL [Mytilus coruscus]